MERKIVLLFQSKIVFDKLTDFSSAYSAIFQFLKSVYRIWLITRLLLFICNIAFLVQMR